MRDGALGLADATDAICLRHFGGRVAAERKADGSQVTAADIAVEAALRERLAELTPAYPILGEEQGGAIDADIPTWVLDPIDATANFVRGVPVFATLIALVAGGEPVVGVVSAPAMGERWAAAAGLGATRNGQPVAVSGTHTLAEAQVLHGGLDWWREEADRWAALGRLADAAWRTRGFGDYWMHLLVAAGHAEVAVEGDVKPWDVAAVQCVVTEAGGRMTGLEGDSSPLTTGEALATNGRLHEQVQALLAAHPTTST
ncbi:MAG: histidinol-phosphatase [Euzebyales bacterium]|nr:histidinol-phosphatase [Euzebyales bacterium]MBA3621170.1 histidinol-phosphatase [Euzebyales bacterium]